MRIFISYAHPDQPFAKRLADDLGRRGYDVWTPELLAVGQNWVKAISAALRDAPVFIALISEAYNRSANTASELATALAVGGEGAERRTILPVKLQPDVQLPPFLNQFVWLDASTPEGYRRVLENIARAIDTRGPIPPPADLARYEEVFPGAAERLLRMAEVEAEHRHLSELELKRRYELSRYVGWVSAAGSVTALAATGAVFSGSPGILQGLAGFVAGVATAAAAFAAWRSISARKDRSAGAVK